MTDTVATLLIKPMTVLGHTVSQADLIAVVNGLANVPIHFIGMDILGPLPDHGFHWKQEVTNRLLQRWRKLSLVSFARGRWSLTTGAWNKMQAACRA